MVRKTARFWCASQDLCMSVEIHVDQVKLHGQGVTFLFLGPPQHLISLVWQEELCFDVI